MLDLGLGKHLRHRVDRRAGHTGGVQRGDQFVARAACEFRAQQRIEQRVVPHARRIGGETFIPDPLRVTENFGEPPELAIVADRKRDKAVRAGKNILRLDIGMAVAAALGRVA